MATVFRGVVAYAEFAACVATFLPIMGAAHRLHRGDPTQRVPGQWMRRLGRTTGRLNPLWDFSIEGAAPADIRTKGYVVVANHESTADPFLLSMLPWDMRWVAKIELFQMPVLGLCFRWSGDIPLVRGNRESVERMMDECRATIAAGMNVMMFPEGTRSASGELGPFKPGAFELAIATGADVLPIALSGTRACRPKGSKWFGEARAIASVLDPIPVAGLGSGDVAALAARARASIGDALTGLRGRTSA